MRLPTIDYEDAQRVVSALTLKNPALALIYSSLGLGGLGFLAGPYAARLLSGEWADEELEKKIRRRFAMAGAALGAAPWLPVLWRRVLSKQAAMPLQLVPIESSLGVLVRDPYLSFGQKFEAGQIFLNAAGAAGLRPTSEGKLYGLLTPGELVRGAVGAGLGYAGGHLAGKMLTLIFSLPPPTVRRLSRAGLLAGLLLGTGVVAGAPAR